MSRHLLVAALASILGVTAVHAQLAETYTLPRPANCCLLNTAVTLAEQLQDWNQLSRYHDANVELRPFGVAALTLAAEAVHHSH